jgi:hypothetical protein
MTSKMLAKTTLVWELVQVDMAQGLASANLLTSMLLWLESKSSTNMEAESIKVLY